MTILTTCWAGLSAPETSAESARSRTAAVNARTTVTATSASSRARRISRTVASMSASDSRPLVRRFLKVEVSRSDRLANTAGSSRSLVDHGRPSLPGRTGPPLGERLRRARREVVDEPGAPAPSRRSAPPPTRPPRSAPAAASSRSAPVVDGVQELGQRGRVVGVARWSRARRASGGGARAGSRRRRPARAMPIRASSGPTSRAPSTEWSRAPARLPMSWSSALSSRHLGARHVAAHAGRHRATASTRCRSTVCRWIAARCGRLRTAAHSGIQVVTTPARSSASHTGHLGAAGAEQRERTTRARPRGHGSGSGGVRVRLATVTGDSDEPGAGRGRRGPQGQQRIGLAGGRPTASSSSPSCSTRPSPTERSRGGAAPAAHEHGTPGGHRPLQRLARVADRGVERVGDDPARLGDARQQVVARRRPRAARRPRPGRPAAAGWCAGG